MPPQRMGDPVCDRICAAKQGERSVVVLCDGCNWGPRPRDAAQKSTATFVDYLTSKMFLANSTDVMGELLLKAVELCHEKIIEGISDSWEGIFLFFFILVLFFCFVLFHFFS